MLLQQDDSRNDKVHKLQPALMKLSNRDRAYMFDDLLVIIQRKDDLPVTGVTTENSDSVMQPYLLSL